MRSNNLRKRCRTGAANYLWLSVALLLWLPLSLRGENWPRWRGPGGQAISAESPLPRRWSQQENLCWKTAIPGEGVSSPIVWQDHVLVTSSQDDGTRRLVHCIDRVSGAFRWSRAIEDDNPELAWATTGYAASTPATDGKQVVAFFGNAGVVCYDFAGQQRWRRQFGEFESELGLATSPIIDNDCVFLVCDHDGSRFTSFDSFLVALHIDSGEIKWKTPRPDLFRSWSTPIVVRAGQRSELIVNAQDELRGYAPDSGKHLWTLRGMTGWVTPSPVYAQELIFATSGKNGPTLAVRPGGRGDVTDSHVVWRHDRGAPYICSPLYYQGKLYVHNEQGILTCYDAPTGKSLYRQRLAGSFMSSAVAGDNHLYFTNDEGTTYVVRAGETFQLVATNSLQDECRASPAISNRQLFIRTNSYLHCVGVP